MDISVLVQTFIAVFVLADATGNILSLTRVMMPEAKNKVIDKVIIVAIAVFLLFANHWQVIFNSLEISTGSLGVAEGLLLLLKILKHSEIVYKCK